MTDYTAAFESNAEAVEAENQNGIDEEKQERTGMIVNCRAVNLRKGPNKNANVLAILPVGEEVHIKGNTGKGWYSVSTEEVSKGYIMEEFVKEK